MENQEPTTTNFGRRAFMGAAAGAAGLLFVKPEQVRGSQANSAIRIGLLGCGSRGTGVVTAFVDSTDSRVTALADLFPGQLDAAKKHWDEVAAKKGYAGPDPKYMFRGPKAYRQIAETKGCDMIVLATPDYFHPQHLEAVVAAGKHVYCEKPAAVDVAGCKRFIEIGRRAEGKLSLEVGFNVRYAPAFRPMVERVHNGAIGKVAFAHIFYHAPGIGYPDRPNASAVEKRVRNFYWDRVLSGDTIVDQDIHMIDMCNWIMGAHPVKAVGTGGRKVRKDESNIWDHWSLTFYYPGDRIASFNAVQFGDTFWDVGGRYFGDKGLAEAYYSGIARIIGPEPWTYEKPAPFAGESADMMNLAFAGVRNSEQGKAQAYIESITSGEYHNQAAEGAQSALSAILGREAAYAGRPMTWDELLASNQSYEGAIDLSSLES